MSRYADEHHDIQAVFRGIPPSRPVGEFLLATFPDPEPGRRFLRGLDATSMVASRAHLHPVVNVALTHSGLAAIGVAPSVLQSFPEDFVEGMAARARIIGDEGASAPQSWEDPWRESVVHAWVGCYARCPAELAETTAGIRESAHSCGIELHAPQSVQRLLYEPGRTRLSLDRADGDHPPGRIFEHFGFADGVSNPPILGIDDQEVRGHGKLDESGRRWAALAAGEFLLSYEDEVGEYAPGPRPWTLARNASFMVYRKLSQDVPAFRAYLGRCRDEKLGLDRDFFAEKMVGRRRDGEPLVQPRGATLNDFVYAADSLGAQCPLGAHARRANPRDQLDFGSTLVDRHRILRRAITYGDYLDPSQDDGDAEDRGLIFLSFNASFARQFEFVQAQWINFGNDLDQGNSRDPVVGRSFAGGRMVIPGEAERPTIFTPELEPFVLTRGGDYFFLPGLRALADLAAGAYSGN